jgi:G3E family GTPase
MKIFLTGGFLGSGKSTAIHKACIQLKNEGVAVGVITNDQGTDLVDTRYIQQAGVTVLEVTDGCFCCNYNRFDQLLDVLRKTEHTELIFAESVGSCTDLVATVVKPLAEFHKDLEVVVSIFADATVLPSMLQGSRLFVRSVNYIYLKQLEEADLIVVSKIDCLEPDHLIKLKNLVSLKYPYKTILFQNSLDDASIRSWVEVLRDFKTVGRKSLNIDYKLYGEGEAALGWLDADLTIQNEHKQAFQNATWLIAAIHSEFGKLNLPIGHLKFIVADSSSEQKISFTSNLERPELLSLFAEKAAESVHVLINARIQMDPEKLEDLVQEIIGQASVAFGSTIVLNKIVAFKPGFPTPTHRIVSTA